MACKLGLAKRDLWGLGAESWRVLHWRIILTKGELATTSHDSAPRPQRSLFAKPNVSRSEQTFKIIFLYIVNNLSASQENKKLKSEWDVSPDLQKLIKINKDIETDLSNNIFICDENIQSHYQRTSFLGRN